MNSHKCPQCERDVNESTNRIIQDTCGHKKCRICLLQDEIICNTCARISNLKNTCNTNNTSCNISVIKYDTKSQSNTLLPNDCCKEKTNTNITPSKLILQNDCNSVTDKTEKCDYKKSLLRRPVTLPSHISVVTKVPVLYKCTICLKTFSTNASVKYHMYCGGVEKPLKCDICKRGFISRSHLETHKLKHSGTRPFVCSLCQKSFTQKSKLNRHMKLHTGDKPFVCSECGKKFTNKDALNGHYRTHSGVKPYSCKHCGSRFNNKSNLTKHLVTHSKDKLYMCEECGKKFSNKWALISHRKCHSRERPYTCQKCSRTFTNIKDLRRHGIIHLDVKPYGCKICNTKFCRKDNLKRHLKNTHSMETQSEIKSATIKYGINKKMVDSITISKTVKDTEPTKTKPLEPEISESTFQENPNAIHVIKTSNDSNASAQNNTNIIPSIRNTVPVINGPFKLAFKTDAFRNNYNILNKNYTESAPRIQTKKPYDMAESLNICQKILSPMNTTIKDNVDTTSVLPIDKPKNVIMSVGKVNEKESLEICKKILMPIDVPPIHYETSFESKKHAVIKNIKFKLPSTYTNNVMKSENMFDTDATILPQENLERVSPVVDLNSDMKCAASEYTELQPMKPYMEENIIDCVNKQSVIVNAHFSDVSNASKGAAPIPSNEMHWRRRTSQILHPKINS